MEEAVDHPPHYNQYEGFEVVQVTSQLNFCLGNACKYILRADFKHDDNGITDLRKAVWYLTYEIERRLRTGQGDRGPIGGDQHAGDRGSIPIAVRDDASADGSRISQG